MVSEAFNDLVSNLRLIEAKTRALAECAFDDPVLDEPLPGRLGRALHESVVGALRLDHGARQPSSTASCTRPPTTR